MTEDDPEEERPTVQSETRSDGTRVVTVTYESSDGSVVRVEHDYPDAIRHHYQPTGMDEDVLLYAGAFSSTDGSRTYQGDVCFRWRPTPRVESTGECPTDANDLAGLFNFEGREEMWVVPDALVFDLADDALPSQPMERMVPHGLPGYGVAKSLVQQALGDPSDLESVTFLIPNGWNGFDGIGICDPDHPETTWHGRTVASGDGWTVTFDCAAAMDSDGWRELERSGGSRFTHVGRIVREDGATFTGEEAFEVLDRVRVALNLALGRRTTCALPVGWHSGKAVWGRWFPAPVDACRDVSHWLDGTIVHGQIAEVVGRVLDFTSDPISRRTLKHALPYYVAANVDVQVELAVAIPISALQLLAFVRFVTNGAHSRAQWQTVKTEDQIRMLLDTAHIDSAGLPARFGGLSALQATLGSTSPPRDALGLVIKMRNVVTHPTKTHPGDFTICQWAEAGMLVRRWLSLALLEAIGYEGQIASSPFDAPRWTGQVEPVPWSAAP